MAEEIDSHAAAQQVPYIRPAGRLLWRTTAAFRRLREASIAGKFERRELMEARAVIDELLILSPADTGPE